MAKGIKIPVSLDTKSVTSGIKKLQNETNTALISVKANVNSLAAAQKRLRESGAGALGGKNFSPTKSAAIAGGIAGVASAITSQLIPAMKDLASFAIRAATAQEDLTLKFKPLLGSIENARARMAELNKFASTTPFQLPDVANASRVLQALTEGALATGEGLRLVGDAAASSGENFQNLAVHVGRAYSGLQANRPIGESMARLQELGLVTGNTRNAIEKLQKAGKGKEAWVVLQKELRKTEGAMKDLSGTTTGIFSTLKDNVEQAFAQGMTPALETFKVAMSSAIVVIQDWIKDGSLIDAGEFLGNLAAVITYVGKVTWNMGAVVVKVIKNMLIDPLKTYAELAVGVFSTVTKAITGDFSGAWESAKQTTSDLADSIITDLKDTGNAFATWTDESANANRDLVNSMEGVTMTAARMRRELANPPVETKRKAEAVTTTDTAKKKAQTESELNEIMRIRNQILIAQGDSELERMRIQNDIEITEIHNKYDLMLDELEKYGLTYAEVEKARFAETQDLMNKENELVAQNAKKRADIEKRKAKELADAQQAQADATAKREQMAANNKLSVIENTTAAAFDVARAAGVKNKGLAVTEAVINTALAITKTFASYGYTPVGIAAGIAQGAAGAAQVAAISQQNFQDGGFPEGRNAQVTVNENGQEAVLNANATARLGKKDINALNNGARPDQLFGNGSQSASQSIEVYYSPVQTFNGGDSGDIISALENEREAFAGFVTESIQKGVLNV